MPIVKGLFPATGTIDNVTFAETEDGVVMKKKVRNAKERLKKGSKYKTMRSFGREFGRASSSGKMIRESLSLLLDRKADSKMHFRLTTAMQECLRSDKFSPLGERCPELGDATVLYGFNFNRHAELDTVFKGKFTATVDRATGMCSIEIPSFAKRAIVAPAGASHYRFLLGAGAYDFALTDHTSDHTEGQPYAVKSATAGPIRLAVNLPKAGTFPMIVVLKLEFLEERRGVMHTWNGGKDSAAEVVAVDALPVQDPTAVIDAAEVRRSRKAPPPKALKTVLTEVRSGMEAYGKEQQFDKARRFGTFLQGYLEALKKKPRAFAQDIGVKSGELSDYLNDRATPPDSFLVRLEIHSHGVIPAVQWYRLIQLEKMHALISDVAAREREEVFVVKKAEMG